MAISPTVQSFMQQTSGEAPSSAEQMFNKSFGEAAFNQLRAKYPTLLDNVVTFRVLDADMDKSTALGAFILRTGNDVRYLPVAMSGGSTVSCEMVYDKNTDQFSPLTGSEIKSLETANLATDPTILRNDAHIEDTKELFRNMIRPPSSSNVVLAGSADGVAALPNGAKGLVSEYLETHPDLLGKIAAFYPVRALAEKLAAVKDVELPAISTGPEIIRIESLTKEAAVFLKDEQRQELLQRGYLVKDATEGSVVNVASLDNFKGDVESELHLTEYPPLEPRGESHPKVHKGEALCVHGSHFVKTPVLLFEDYMVSDKTHVTCLHGGSSRQPQVVDAYEKEPDCRQRVLLSGFTSRVTVKDMQDRGCREGISGLKSLLDEYKSERNYSLYIFPPARSGGFLHDKALSFYVYEYKKDSVHVNSVQESHYVTGLDSPVQISPNIRYGYLKTGNNIIVPEQSLFLILPDSYTREAIPGVVGSFDNLRKLVGSLGTRISVHSEGSIINVTDAEKTASFGKEADAAAYLQGRWGLTGSQIRTVLDSKASLLMHKTAFSDGDGPDNYSPADGVGQQQEMPAEMMPQQPQFDPSGMEDFAAMSDPELMDTGILASFAQDPDIKGLLVDYLPNFIATLDKVGRVILLMCLNKGEMEEFYGRDKYGELLLNCRKVFRLVGDMVSSLKQYINM